jgi:hypothetical protein
LDKALDNWPRELTLSRLETLEAELRVAFLPPSNVFERLSHLLRRRHVEVRRRAAREPWLALPNPFPDRTLPDAEAPAEAWNDFLTTWKTWAEAARVIGLVESCEDRVAQLPRAEDSLDT